MLPLPTPRPPGRINGAESSLPCSMAVALLPLLPSIMVWFCVSSSEVRPLRPLLYYVYLAINSR